MTAKKIRTAPATQPDRPDLDALLTEWQPRMKLGDWEIIVRYVPWLDSAGLCTVWLKSKRALIQIHEPASWPDSSFKRPVEQVFLHEMGHVQMARLNIAADAPSNVHEEQIVEAYAKALYAAKYAPLT
jgi:hypothetical protein